ncbi:uncharacterized protein BDR25DRAFT_300517 [Lindgomyces ingoldianus]|uniref:Uncharacterized protein n=1 Tax=Lindgomyces ingoldianus TaxID=673940 RepID=A0ACB6RDG2_9PLEO|nr:uncharacterized protein BDR25DRAFT_300517 [Lindgomyces ingoldianus]KAF2476562.1 hypothetical protein BDR25DRAFT_300517 [Lindgomyces ingoldianus]
MKQPSFEVDCTFYEQTKTKTEYTDCGGCTLQTKFFGLGLVSHLPHSIALVSILL